MPLNVITVAPGGTAAIQNICTLAGAVYGVNAAGFLFILSGGAWVAVTSTGFANVGGPTSLAVSGGKIYASGVAASADVFVWDGVTSWVALGLPVAFPAYNTIWSIADHAGSPHVVLAGSGFTAYEVVRWNGSAFVTVTGTFAALSASRPLWAHSFAGSLYLLDALGTLYVSGGPPSAVSGVSCDVFNQVGNGRPPLFEFAGSLYLAKMNTGTVGSLYRWNGVNAWVSLVAYSGALSGFISMASFGGALYIVKQTATLYHFDGISSIPNQAVTNIQMNMLLPMGPRTFALATNLASPFDDGRLMELTPVPGGAILPIFIPGL